MYGEANISIGKKGPTYNYKKCANYKNSKRQLKVVVLKLRLASHERKLQK